MEDFVWRPRAKAVAIVDIVFLCLSTIVAFAYIFLFSSVLLETINQSSNSGLYADTNDGTETHQTIQPNVFYGILAFVGVIVAIVVALQLWAAVKLLRAGTIGEDPKNALRMSLFWRNMTIVMTILSIAGQLRNFNIFGLIFTLVWRGISFYIVHQYVQELESHLKSPRSAVNYQPEDVIVKK